MPISEGKYDDLATDARERAGAIGCLLMIINGDKGSGFSVQAPFDVHKRLPDLLRYMADEIEDAINDGRLGEL